jgi:hypothetical protein
MGSQSGSRAGSSMCGGFPFGFGECAADERGGADPKAARIAVKGTEPGRSTVDLARQVLVLALRPVSF